MKIRLYLDYWPGMETWGTPIGAFSQLCGTVPDGATRFAFDVEIPTPSEIVETTATEATVVTADREKAWEMMKEQCEACRKHGAPTIQGSDHESASNPDGWAHETGSHSWTSCKADNEIVSLFMGEER